MKLTTPEQEERLRELYRKNYLAHILLPPEVVADEFPPNAAVGKEGPAERPPHLAKSLLESKIHRGNTLRTSAPFPQALPSAQ